MGGRDNVFGPEFSHCGAKSADRARVRNNGIRRPAFFVHLPLCGLPLVKLRLRPAPGSGPFQPQFARRIDHQNDVAKRLPAGLKQQWGIEHHGRFARCRSLFGTLFQTRADSRVKHAFEKRPVTGCAFGTAEYVPRDRSPIDPTVGCQDGISPAAHQQSVNFGIIVQNFVTGTVGIEMDRPQVDEHFRNPRFAASHAAHQADGDSIRHDRYLSRQDDGSSNSADARIGQLPVDRFRMIPARDYRPDIDGLRAVAVLGVILFHAGLGCTGGYAGVDVFFVISGFLITGLVLKEQRADRFSLTTFWERRIRRILPALAVVVAITLALGTAILFPSELIELVKSAMAQLALGANVYFWRNAGYFDAPAEMQPLLHTWSLAVEEQFYLGFPLLLIVCRRLSRRQLQAVLSSILIISFALSAWGTYSHPTATFYLLPSRAWELLIGALLATIATDSRLPRWLAESLSWAGLGAIAFAFFAYGSTTRFPGANALLPCVGAALLIWSNIGERTAAGRLLSLGPIVAVGLMSYSLYLWHWPILVFMRYRVSDTPALDLRLAAIAASFVLAGLSWRFVETPFRRRAKDRGQWRVFASGFAVTGGLFLVSVVIWRLNGLPQRFPAEIVRFAEQNDFPSEFETDRVEQIEAGELPVVGQANGAEAAFLIWGDSHAPPVAAAVREIASKYRLWGYVAANPGITPVLGTWRPQVGKEAVKRNQAVLDFVRRKGIKTVILASDWFVNTHPRSNGSLDSLIIDDKNESIDPRNALEALQRGLRTTVSELQRSGADVWIMRQVPMQHDVPSGFAFDAWRQHHKLPEFGVKLAEHRKTHATLDSIFSELERQGVHMLDPAEVCFNRSHQSVIAASGRSYYWDRTHLSAVGSEQMLSHLFEPLIEHIAQRGLSAASYRPRDAGAN